MKFIKSCILFLQLLNTNLCAKTICLIPYYKDEPESNLFSPGGYWTRWKEELIKKGHELISYSNPKRHTAKYAVSVGLHYDMNMYHEFARRGCKQILIILEPPSTDARAYDKSNHKYFHKIFTWNDDLVDNIKYFKYMTPFFGHPKHTAPVYQVNFSQKKFSAIFCGNKSSNHPDEIYSERRNTISFFENLGTNELDLYGPGWSSQIYRCYKGTTPEKVRELSNYKFNICYENIKNIKGYISEKLFDTFLAGTVPVYWGASNIEEYVPKECFIDRRNFNSNQELYDFLKNMDENTYEGYIRAIKEFLLSDKTNLFTYDAMVDALNAQV